MPRVLRLGRNRTRLPADGRGRGPAADGRDNHALQRAALKNLRVVAVTGHNEALAAHLQAKYGATAEIYGFREDVPQLMAGADMIITKAGGLTSAEVLASGLDLLIYKPLRGRRRATQLSCSSIAALW